MTNREIADRLRTLAVELAPGCTVPLHPEDVRRFLRGLHALVDEIEADAGAEGPGDDGEASPVPPPEDQLRGPASDLWDQ